ncbi:NAD(P)-binding protein [Marasmius fiardii PR-910]|nr:NAD(P)-binding protein [Marasmius fiardii PR-910]
MARALVLGGHGKVATRITKLLAAQNHHVVSVIRTAEHVADIRALAPSHNIQLVEPVVASIEDADDEVAARMMKDIDWVVWSAGAGGKGGPERTKAVDEIGAKRFIKAALEAPSVKKYLIVSTSSARRRPASYWSEEDVAAFNRSWENIGVYCQAKLNVEEYLLEESRKSSKEGWEDIHLRPGTLSDDPGVGKVELGKAKRVGKVSRDDVAAVAVELLKRGNAGGLWLDLIGGDEPIEAAVDRVLSQRVTAKE